MHYNVVTGYVKLTSERPRFLRLDEAPDQGYLGRIVAAVLPKANAGKGLRVSLLMLS